MIPQILEELEHQRNVLDIAITALRQVQSPAAAAGTNNTAPATKKRGRPPGTATKKQPNPPAEPTRHRRTYSDDFRRKLVAFVKGGKSLGAATRKFGVTWFTAREWVNSGKFDPPAPAAGPAAAKKKKAA